LQNGRPKDDDRSCGKPVPIPGIGSKTRRRENGGRKRVRILAPSLSRTASEGLGKNGG